VPPVAEKGKAYSKPREGVDPTAKTGVESKETLPYSSTVIVLASAGATPRAVSTTAMRRALERVFMASPRFADLALLDGAPD